MIEGEEQEILLNTLAEQPQEEVRTIEEDIYVIGVESLNGQAGDLTLKNINGEDLVGEGNIALQTPLDETQMAAVNSGIDSTEVGQIATNADNITTLQNTKQDNLTQTQLNAVNSGIDQTKVAQIATNTGNITSNTSRITTIEGKIPSTASSSNKLTDKNYVDNAIATNTANYISDNGQPFQSYADLEAYSGPLTNNDYAFVVSTDAVGNLLYTRYKYNADQDLWAEEYTISNPTFTSDQWASINSGVTANDVSQIGTNKSDIAGLQTGKQDTLSQTQLDAANSGIDATKVQQIADNTTAIATKQDKLVAGTNIQIASDGKTISATDTTYTAGTGLTLTGTQFSVTEAAPSGFFTDTQATRSAEGTTFTIADTIEAPVDDVRLKGNTYQEAYSGKNLFNYQAVSNLGLYGSVLQENTNYRGYTFPVQQGQSYTISRAVKTGNNRFRVAFTKVLPAAGVTFYGENGEAGTSPINFDSSLAGSFSVPTDMNYGFVYLSNQGDTIDASLQIQLEKGGTATTYEKFVGGLPSPSPDYPQDVQTVTGNQKVQVVGKNWFDDSMLYHGYYDAGNPESFTPSEAYRTAIINNLPAGSYYFSCDLVDCYRLRWYGDGENHAVQYETDRLSFTTTTNGKVMICFRNKTSTTITQDVKCQVELGSRVTTYEPYEGRTYSIDLDSIELCKIGTYQDYIWKDGNDWKVHKAVGKAVFNGTEVWTKVNLAFQTNPIVPESKIAVAYSDNFTFYSTQVGITNNIPNGEFGWNTSRVPTFRYDSCADETAWETWLSTHNTTVYYVLATATETVITDASLIADLEAFASSKSYDGETNYFVTATGTDLPAILTVDVFKNNYAALMARLNKAGA